MSAITFCDVNGLNAGLAHGFVAAGLEMTARVGDLALGRAIVNANRRLWGRDWSDNITPGETEWRDWPVPVQSRVITAVPPCSGRPVQHHRSVWR